jgi:hypothetical protein
MSKCGGDWINLPKIYGFDMVIVWEIEASFDA